MQGKKKTLLRHNSLTRSMSILYHRVLELPQMWTISSYLLTDSLSLNLAKTSLKCFVEPYCSNFVFVKHLKIGHNFSQ